MTFANNRGCIRVFNSETFNAIHAEVLESSSEKNGFFAFFGNEGRVSTLLPVPLPLPVIRHRIFNINTLNYESGNEYEIEYKSRFYYKIDSFGKFIVTMGPK